MYLLIFKLLNMKQKIFIISLTFWAILSALYIWYDIFDKTKSSIADSSYQSWMETAFWLVLQQWLDEACKPVNITDGTTQVNLINIECLQQAPVE